MENPRDLPNNFENHEGRPGPNGGIVFDPVSAPLDHAVPYRYELGHCGLLSPVDVDGSFWNPVDGTTADGAELDLRADSEMINATGGLIVVIGDEAALQDRVGIGRALRAACRREGIPGLRLEMETHEITVDTGRAPALVDLTGECARFLDEIGAADGLLTVFVPHATAGVVVVELGAGTEPDLQAALDRLLPRDDRWVHAHGSPGHGADHVLPLLVSPSLVVPVVGGRMTLGTWQSIALLDPNRDNARRSVRLTFLPG